jgi:hypothetical protein
MVMLMPSIRLVNGRLMPVLPPGGLKSALPFTKAPEPGEFGIYARDGWRYGLGPDV